MATSRFLTLLGRGAAIWPVNPGGASLEVVDGLARAGAACLFIDCERTAIGDMVDYATQGQLERVFAIAQIESKAAVDNAAALAGSTSVNGFLIGPMAAAVTAAQPERRT